jgi:mono/diheme cytochrome c family protein
VHGRIYRITYPSRPLVKPVAVDGASIEALLENLKQPEYRARYRSRRELREHTVAKVIPAVKKWAAALDSKNADYPHHLLEALWVTWSMNAVDSDLLQKCLSSTDYHVRAAAVRVLRYSFDEFPDSLDLLKKAASDEHGRVRLEATMAATWHDKPEALEVVTIAKSKGVDDWSKEPTKAAEARLQGKVEKIEEENPMPPIPATLSDAEKASFKAGHEIYFREGHCSTCHQKDGKGLDPAFPPLHNSIFVHGNPERLIKLTLHGVMGAFELNGKKYDGQVPMTPFGGMLNDKEIADVLTYARNHFGNSASAITPQQVAAVRQATKGVKGFYQMENLIKEHPLEK